MSDSDEEANSAESRGASPTLDEHAQIRNNFLMVRKKFLGDKEEDRQKLLMELGKVAFDTIQNIENAGAKSQIKIDELQARLIPLQDNYEQEKKKLDFYYTLQTPTKHHLKAAAIQSAHMTKAGANLQLEHRKVDREITAELQRASCETTRFWALQRAPIQQLCKDFADRWSLRGQTELIPLAQKMNRAKHKNHEDCLAAGALQKRKCCDSDMHNSEQPLPAGKSQIDPEEKNIITYQYVKIRKKIGFQEEQEAN